MPTYKKTGRKGFEKWNVVFDLPSIDGQRVQKRLSGFPSKRDAEMAYISFKSEQREVVRQKAKPVFVDVAQRFLRYTEQQTKESTYMAYYDTMNGHILPHFKNFSVPDIKPTDVIAWLAQLNDKGYSFNYKAKMLAHLKAFFNYCRDIEEIIKDSPAKKRFRIVDSGEKKEMLIYSPEEYKQFRQGIMNAKNLLLFDLLYYTGMRKGEMLALKWTDIKDDRLSISKTYTRKTKDGSWKITTPKSKNSARTISIPDFLANNLKIYLEKNNINPSHYILGGEIPLGEKNIDTARDKALEKARNEFPELKRIRIHDFRHSHVSFLISENVDPVSIAKRIGDTVEQVLRTYAHLIPDKEKEVISKLNLISPM